SKGEVRRSVTRQIRETVDQLYGIYQDAPADAWRKLPRPPRLSQEQLDAAIEQVESVELPKHKKIATAREKDVMQARADDWDGFIKNGLPKAIAAGEESYYKKPITPEMAAAYRPLLDHAAAELVGRIANQTEATYRLLQKFDAAYQELKIRRRGLRFDDVTARLSEELDGGPIAALSFRIDGHVTHLLLDEFQDTSLRQWMVLRPLAERVTDGTDGRSFFCVGDVKQAIYGWRGGVSELFDEVGRQLDGLTEETLTRSWRSSRTVIETVNKVFQSLADNPALAEHRRVTARWSESFQLHETARTDLAGYCRLITAPLGEDKEQQDDLTLQLAARRVAELSAACPGRTIGVLVRKNDAVGRLIQLLRSAGVRASEEGGNPLTDSVAVGLVLSLL
ncbi:MAG: UvrD-helicase domain-containing protein, partial [Planctomycetaceae bacterium]